jgi:hypothetical protein
VKGSYCEDSSDDSEVETYEGSVGNLSVDQLAEKNPEIKAGVFNSSGISGKSGLTNLTFIL